MVRRGHIDHARRVLRQRLLLPAGSGRSTMRRVSVICPRLAEELSTSETRADTSTVSVIWPTLSEKSSRSRSATRTSTPVCFTVSKPAADTERL